jgi:predicted RNA methylase
LVERVNRLLGEYYGAPIPEDRAPDPDTGLNDPKTTPAKRYGFFPTPDAAADLLMERARVYRINDGEPLTVLEPSAGTGNLARRCADVGAVVDCVEIQPALAVGLRESAKFRSVYAADFLALKPEVTGLYDRVVMNPPFDRERDIDHVMHALRFLKPGGHLAAIMSAGTEFRETKKATAFRELMQSMRACWRDLPPRSFAEAGTNCNTLILTVFKDGREHW